MYSFVLQRYRNTEQDKTTECLCQGYLNSKKYELYTEDNEDSSVPADVKEHEGRAIVLKNDSERIYCWASGYSKTDSQELNSYPN